MKRIVFWGTGKAYKSYLCLYKRMVAEGFFEVVGHVNGNNQDWKQIPPAEITQKEFDCLIIATNWPEVQEAKQQIAALGIPEEKLSSLSSCIFAEEQQDAVHQTIVNRQIKVIREILAAKDEELADPAWMREHLETFGLYPFDTHGNQNIFWTHYGIMQILDEFVPFCCELSRLENVEKAIEIGVYRGRSSYIMCAILARKNPKMTYTCVDICDNLDYFERYQEVLPNLIKAIPYTSDDFAKQPFDFAFIDADHSYDGSMKDYKNVGKYAKVACFHDIYGHEYDQENGGTVRSWKEIAQMNREHTVRVFSHYPDEWMGIGWISK